MDLLLAMTVGTICADKIPTRGRTSLYFRPSQ